MKKFISFVFILIFTCSCVTLLAGCDCKHEYVESQVDATCSAEGYNLFTCSKCGDSYKGDLVTPKKSHSGRDICSVCGESMIALWKDFIDKYGTQAGDNKYVISEGAIVTVAASYNSDYDCFLTAMGHYTDSPFAEDRTFSLGYNSYDKQWVWVYEGSYGFDPPIENIKNVTGTAGGAFSEWSSRSNTLPCTTKTGDYFKVYDNSEFLDVVKKLYNEIIDTFNTKLSGCGYTFTLANLGLSN